jgi:hypothetical protein
VAQYVSLQVQFDLEHFFFHAVEEELVPNRAKKSKLGVGRNRHGNSG